MIKKMRRRMIMAAMLAFSAVILMIAMLVNVVNYIAVTGRTDRTLDMILNFEDMRGAEPRPTENAMPPFRGLPDAEANYMTRFFTVRFNEKDEVMFASMDFIAAIDKDEAVSYARRALEKGKDRGYMKAYRYLKTEINNETLVVFMNTSLEQQSMRSLLLLTLAISFVSLIIVFFLVRFFSKRAIRPFAKNIRQQKQFITDASHELKTPLTSISTSIDVITMEHGDDEWTDNIRKQTERMSKLVSELVTLSRLDEDMPLPDKEEFNLSNAAMEIAEIYEPQAKAHEKNYTTDIEENIIITGDEASIKKMFSVLLDNAIRYSDDKGDIRFSIYKKGGKINIEVFNTCCYDEVPDVERLFDRFYRPDSSRSTETGGNGVGLSIAKAVALAHGGDITASCPSGKTMLIKILL